MSAGFDPGTGLGPRLRVAREQRELSVRELARRIGCSASLISQIERGISVPSVGVLYSLATELDTSLDHLLFGAEPRRPLAAAPGPDEPGVVAPGSVAPGSVAPGSVAPGSVAPGIVQRAAGRNIIDLASGVRWERLTPGADAMTDFLEVIYSPGGHSTDERRPLRHDGHERGLRELRTRPGRLDRVRLRHAARIPEQDRRRGARDLGRGPHRARPRVRAFMMVDRYGRHNARNGPRRLVTGS
jgi:DNA-binding XRE family transcriptional regulator